MVESVRHYLIEYLDNKNRNIIVSVSGGADSMVLLNLLISLKTEFDLNIICTHFNHKKRAASEIEFEYLKNYCLDKDIIFEGYEFEYTESELSSNFQSVAREKRIKYLMQIAKKYKSKLIFLGQHGDDQIETILYKISRGSSIRGYSGIRDVYINNNIMFIRPLLNYTKDDIYAYCETNNIKYFEDESNMEDAYFRNRIRKNIIPSFKKESQNIHLKFNQFSNILNDIQDYFEKLSEKYIKNNVSILGNKIKFENDSFNKLHISLKRHILVKLVTDQFINVELDFNKINDMILFIENNKGSKKMSLSNEVFLKREYNSISILNDEYELNFKPYEIKGFGEYKIDNNNILGIYEKGKNHKENKNLLCYNNIEFPLLVRTRKDGDNIELSFGHKKLKDLFIDLKISKFKRDDIILLVNSNNEIICIPELGIIKHNEKLGKVAYIAYSKEE